MANMRSWVTMMNSVKGLSPEEIFRVNIKSTSDKYAEIKNLGLETVMWKFYSSNEIISGLPEIQSFIGKNNPCLFIYDPRVSDLKKGFLFGIKTHEPVYNWVVDNLFSTDNYNYLITTQIENPGKGFVGSAFSNGRGKMWCETLHTQGVCNQRDLSQPNQQWENFASVINELYIDREDDLFSWSVSGNHLTKKDVEKLQELYLHREGYFEFVKGMQAGREGIYTVGYEFGRLFELPDNVHHYGCINTGYRARGLALKENKF
jgi:hypothetical protein